MPRRRNAHPKTSKRRVISTRRKKVIHLPSLYLVAKILLVFGFVSIAGSLTWYIVDKNKPLSSSAPKEATSSSTLNVITDNPIRIDKQFGLAKQSTQLPLRVVVPRLGIDISIVEAAIVNGYWEISETTASHGMGSGSPGELGNTVIFAHARAGLFLPLRNAKIGDHIYILTKDRWFRYQVETTKLVTPKQTEVIKPTKDETLTLFTCSGFMDSKRAIVVAKPLYP